MKTSKIIRIKRDEYGYSIYWGAHTRLEKGSERLADVRRKRAVRVAFADAMTAIATREDRTLNPSEQTRLYNKVRSMASYHGSTLKNTKAIVKAAIDLFDQGL